MALKLFNVCVVLALAAGCLGGVLASAACPHLGCDTPGAAQVNSAAHADHTEGGAHHGANHTARGAAHSAEPSAQERAEPCDARSSARLTSPREADCTHCLGRPPNPPSRPFEWQPDTFRDGAKLTAPHIVERTAVPLAASVREITPARHAPPGRPGRHILLSVFRI